MSDADQVDAATAALALQKVLLSSDRIEEFLTDLARRAAGSVEHAQSCGVTVQPSRSARLYGATTDEFAGRMDAAQYDMRDGPCLHCLRSGEVVSVPDIATDPRWPTFARRGRAEGAGSSLSVPLIVKDRSVGALNLYSRDAHALDEADCARAGRFADVAAGAVGVALRLVECEANEKNLEVALRSRSTVDQAIGILMGQARITSEEAFDLLRRRSQHTNVKLRDVAAAIVAATPRRPTT